MKLISRYTMMLLAFVVLLTTVAPVAMATGTTSNSGSKKLVLGTSADFAPYEFHKVIDGKDQIVGFDISIAKEIAADLGAELVIEDMGFDGLLPALQSGRVDMVISGMTPTDDRRQSIDFSDTYYKSKQVIMVRSADKDKYPTMADLENEKIGVQKGSIQETIGQGIPGAKLTALDKISDIVLQLQTNRVNAAIVEDTVAAGYLDDVIGLAPAIPDEEQAEAAIGIRKGNTELLNAVNGTLERLKSENKIDQMVTEASKLMAEKSKQNILQVFWQYKSFYATGVGYTLLLSALGVIFGVIIALIICLFRLHDFAILRWIGTAYVEVIRGTPMLVQLMIIYYGVSLTFGINFSALQAGIITLSINSGAYLAEIFRAGIQGVDRGQLEAARSLGMGRGAAMRFIVLPQAFKAVLPAIGNEFVTIIKESSIISVIGMVDIMYQASVVKNITYQGMNPFLIAAAIYFVLTFILSKLLGRLERKLSASDRR
ncbi:ABC transporter substrate-binding protein/permease [Paenibacillus taichungensis]|uniref:ABC transporter substrate-binding protein/permease n=1 Tax=Paenibacillus taichungensis TaxID=484184 RepID=UPI002DB6409B|nr:ABC transporter substrate-binding protein/permease [Paenibacillus taichungensis]MEC0107711.1 ABC transporter substrate-binding protein/permease [Paenibacillus taichungensis]MEC0198774.1 ABC transporter substrate-binding protein/permease [Paenibacillus taichungensis]